jgi:hypothetical protein
VVFGVALRGRQEPRGQHKVIHQQELISLRLETEDAVSQAAETGHAYQTGGCRRNVLEISVRQYGRPKSRRMVQRLPQQRFRGPVERPEVSQWN